MCNGSGFVNDAQSTAGEDLGSLIDLLLLPFKLLAWVIGGILAIFGLGAMAYAKKKQRESQMKASEPMVSFELHPVTPAIPAQPKLRQAISLKPPAILMIITSAFGLLLAVPLAIKAVGKGETDQWMLFLILTIGNLVTISGAVSMLLRRFRSLALTGAIVGIPCSMSSLFAGAPCAIWALLAIIQNKNTYSTGTVPE